MEIKDFKITVSKIPDQTWVNEVSYNFHFNGLNYQNVFVGITSIYEFVDQQVSGWNKVGDDLPKEIANSKGIFQNIKNELEKFVDAISKKENLNIAFEWENFKNNNQFLRYQNKQLFPYDAVETIFLIRVFNDHKEFYRGAYNYITKNFNLSNRDDFTGALMAYEFVFRESSEITNRRSAEKSSIGKLKNDFKNYISRSEEVLIGHLKTSNEELAKHVQLFDELKTSKEQNFSQWFEEAQNGYDTFKKGAMEQMKELEDLYEEKLRLEKPAAYWKIRSGKLKKEARWSTGLLVFLVIIAASSLFFLLWLTPDGVFLNFIEDPVKSIKWSLIFITFLSFFAYGIKILSKISFSSFHLARDAEEREQLTHVYLALLKENNFAEGDRNLILQSLFSRAETGLLKDDSSPTMPGNLIRKILENGNN